MQRFIIIISVAVTLFFGGCQSNNESMNGKEESITKLSSNMSTDQLISNDVKNKLIKRDDLKAVYAVNTMELLIVAFEVPHINRFRLASLEKDIKKELEKEFPKLEMIVSSDKKIVLELRDLETKVQSGMTNQGKLNKELKKIQKLSEEET